MSIEGEFKTRIYRNREIVTDEYKDGLQAEDMLEWVDEARKEFPDFCIESYSVDEQKIINIHKAWFLKWFGSK